MIVHGTALANLPADGDEFVESGFVDQVAGVVLGIPAQKRRETGFRDRHFGEQCLNRFGGIEGGRGQGAQFLDEFVNGNPLRYRQIHGCVRQTIEYTAPCGWRRGRRSGLAGTDRGTSEFSEGHGHHIEDLGGRQANPDALPNAGSAYVAEQVGGGGFEGRNFRFLRRQRCGLQIDWPRGIGRFRFVGIEDLGRVDNFRPQGEQDPRLRNDVEDRFGGQVESRLRLGRDAIGQVSQKRSPPEVAELVGDEFADIDGAGFQFEGGSVSGEMTSPMLENTVRNQGRRKRSPSKRPISTGLEVSCRGGSFSGAKVSRRLPASDLQSGCVRPGGGSRSSGISIGGADCGSGSQASAALERYGIRVGKSRKPVLAMLDAATRSVTRKSTGGPRRNAV